MPIKRKKAPSSRIAHTTHATFWSIATLVAFPAVMLTFSSSGVSALYAFIYGLFASLGVVIMNALMEKHLWMFDPIWRERFEHPEFGYRVAVMCGALLLVLESAFLIVVFTDPALDRTLLSLVEKRQCATEERQASDVCLVLSMMLNGEIQ
jgi:hypothetical protein